MLQDMIGISRKVLGRWVALGLLMAASWSPLLAQDRTEWPAPTRDQISETLQVFMDGNRTLGAEAGMQIRTWMKGAREAKDRATLTFLTDGLIRVVLEGKDTHFRNRAYAELRLFEPVGTTRSGLTLGVLRQAYYSTEEVGFRSLVIEDVASFPEQESSIPFLTEIAVEPDGQGGLTQERALLALARMGEAGRETLRTLHEKQEVRHPHAKQTLDRLASQGFRIKTH